MKKKIVPVLISIVGISALFLTAGCETTEGFGRDVEDVGESIEDAAN